ncbi:MAG: hypothetical protein ACKOAS_07060 [Verrucomicrobiota bacterium]
MKDDLPENDALWALLAKSRPASASPFFARNVLREIRRPSPANPLQSWLRWLTPAAYAILALGFFLSLGQENQPTATCTVPAPVDLLELFDEAPDPTEFTPAHLAGL